MNHPRASFSIALAQRFGRGLLLAGAAGLFSLVVVDAADWARFRGPNGSGIATDAKPPAGAEKAR